MAGILTKAGAAMRNAKTYQLGLLQTKAYRLLKQYTDEALTHLKITSTEWAFVGLLYDSKGGMRAMDIARELGVEAPFVTTLIKKLTKQRLIQVLEDTKDSRVKRICLTAEGKKFVDTTEEYLRNKMRILVKGVTISDLVSYASVLELIIKNGTNN